MGILILRKKTCESVWGWRALLDHFLLYCGVVVLLAMAEIDLILDVVFDSLEVTESFVLFLFCKIFQESWEVILVDIEKNDFDLDQRNGIEMEKVDRFQGHTAENGRASLGVYKVPFY